MQSRRLVLWGLLSLALCGLFVHYGATADARSPYPPNDEVAADYERYVGETVRVSGRVTAVRDSDRTMTIRVGWPPDFGELTVSDADRTTSVGGTVQVVGTLRADRRLAADRVVVVNRTASSESYKYAVSLAGASLVLVAFFREWRFEPDTRTFEVRRDG